MNIIKNILKAFDNSEMATLNVSYCSVDDEYTATLKTIYGTQEFVSNDPEKVLTLVYKSVEKGAK